MTLSDLEIRLRLSTLLVSRGYKINDLPKLIKYWTGEPWTSRRWLEHLQPHTTPSES